MSSESDYYNATTLECVDALSVYIKNAKERGIKLAYGPINSLLVNIRRNEMKRQLPDTIYKSDMMMTPHVLDVISSEGGVSKELKSQT